MCQASVDTCEGCHACNVCIIMRAPRAGALDGQAAVLAAGAAKCGDTVRQSTWPTTCLPVKLAVFKCSQLDGRSKCAHDAARDCHSSNNVALKLPLTIPAG